MDFFIFLICLCCGSFINVVAYSLPRNIDFLFRRSRCDYCYQQLNFNDMIPVLSFIFLKGKCRYCHHKINMRDPLIEFISGCLGLFLYKVVDYKYFISFFIFFMILILMSLIDIDTMYVYDELLIFLFIISLSLLDMYNLRVIERIEGMIILSSLMIVFNKFCRESFGGGDIKLFMIFGFLFGLEGVLCIFIYASFITTTFSSICIVIHKLKYNSYIAFVPFMSMGVFSYVAFGNIFLT